MPLFTFKQRYSIEDLEKKDSETLVGIIESYPVRSRLVQEAMRILRKRTNDSITKIEEDIKDIKREIQREESTTINSQQTTPMKTRQTAPITKRHNIVSTRMRRKKLLLAKSARPSYGRR